MMTNNKSILNKELGPQLMEPPLRTCQKCVYVRARVLLCQSMHVASQLACKCSLSFTHHLQAHSLQQKQTKLTSV